MSLLIPQGVTIAEGPSGRSVRVGRGEVAYEAFVPNPLPAPLTLTRRLITILSEADRALGELAGLGRMIPNPDLLISPFIRKEAVLSSKIEGTEATMTEVYSFEAELSMPPTRRRARIPPDVIEVFNHIDATRYGLVRINELPISLRLIKELHERLMRGVRGEDKSPGEFRRTQNWIGSPGCLLKDATYVPPPVPEMERSLDRLETYLHAEDDLPPLIRLAMIHSQFEMIHPFIDGNGRIGRLLIVLLMVHWNLLPIPLLYLSAFFERNRETYYERLLGVSARGEWEEWISFFLQGIGEQARDATTRAKKLQDLQAEWRGQVTSPRSSTLTLRLVDGLFESPVVRVPRAQALLGVTYPSAKQNIDKLVQAGILEPYGDRTYSRAWIAPRILELIDG